MSRIHEALKKAEEERAASQGGPAQPNYATQTAEPPAAVEEPQTAVATGMPAAGGVPRTSAMPSFASPYSLDALLARCPQLPWKPEEKTMLFFHAGGNAPRTEEFRT